MQIRNCEFTRSCGINLGDGRVRGGVVLSTFRAGTGPTKCAYPSCNQKNLHRVPNKTRYNILKRDDFYIPSTARVCVHHLNESNWTNVRGLAHMNTFTPAQVTDMMKLLQNDVEFSANPTGMELDSDLRTNIKRNTSLTYEDFCGVLDELVSLKARDQKPHIALYMYLMKMRTGWPDEDIKNIFHVSLATVNRKLRKVREAMREDFVGRHVNYQRTRDELITHNTQMSNIIFGEGRVMLICDGTYIYVNKSRNFQFQKQSYNGHKKRNFVRIMMVVACDGTVAYALGPYKATDNDAKVLVDIFRDTTCFDNLIDGDIMILDRGFRDCHKFITDQNLVVKLPTSLVKPVQGQQLSTKEANESRLVTALRFVVETKNGHLKTIFKIFDKTWNSLWLPHLALDIEICCSLMNRFSKSCESNKGMAVEIANRMLRAVDTPNELHPIVTKSAFQKNLKSFNVFLDYELLPDLTLLDLCHISLGKYQIHQAESYCRENSKKNDSRFEVFKCPDDVCRTFFQDFFVRDKEPILLLGQFDSRFRNKVYHNTFALIDANGIGDEAVLGYHCECFVGRRTVGCCSHVMTILWSVLYAKNRDVPKPAAFLDTYFMNC